MRRGLRLWVCALVAAVAVGGGLVAEPLRLGPDAMRQLAFETMQAGFAGQALVYTDALLTRDAQDATALIIRSQALRALGQTAAARKAARTAWAAAKTDPGRYGASMAMAQALSPDGRRTEAQFWLRRAAEFAPNERAHAIARRDFGYVKSRNPWTLQLDATAAPSSNVNNGSQQDQMTLSGLPFWLDIPPESQALSGFELGLGASATYRFAQPRPDRQTTAHVGVAMQSVVLSQESRQNAPEAEGADYAYGAIEAGVAHRRALMTGGKTGLSYGATVGHNGNGGADLSDFVQVELGLDHKLGDGSSLTFGVSGDHVARIDRPIQSSDRTEVRIGYGRTLAKGIGAGDRLALSLRASQTRSDSAEVANAAVGFSFGWTKAKPVANVTVAAGLDVDARSFADSRYVAGGRDDLRVTARLSMTFQNIDYMGFSPVLDLRATRNQSNAALFDTQDVGISLGIRSSF